MKQKIATLAIERFRALRQLKIEGLGRVNLITGRNNTGKSSVLEALRILAADASPSVILNILRYREEDLGDSEDVSRPIDAEGLFQMSSLFHGFPQVSDSLEPIVIESIGGQRPMRLTMQVGWFSEEREADGSRRMVPQQKGLFGDGESLPQLVAEGGGGRRIFPLDFSRRYAYRPRLGRSELIDEPRLACVFVSPYGGERTGTLGTLWDKIALSDREKDVVDALKIIDPEISAVSMVGGEGPRQTRTAIVRAQGFPRPVPLRSFGDGLNRLFGIVLSLVNAKDGLLLIDEFENSMHHTVQADAWRVIFRLARRLDIQVFATSHSWDSIESFQKVAAEDPDEGVLIRLSRRGEDIIPTLFREDELAVATRDRIEVR
ncbi:MAG: AAA family ATPase [Deltaproteobacteria bacterium]|nr:AAA family ATPase [Deltaproteobacteria bacterium]